MTTSCVNQMCDTTQQQQYYACQIDFYRQYNLFSSINASEWIREWIQPYSTITPVNYHSTVVFYVDILWALLRNCMMWLLNRPLINVHLVLISLVIVLMYIIYRADKPDPQQLYDINQRIQRHNTKDRLSDHAEQDHSRVWEFFTFLKNAIQDKYGAELLHEMDVSDTHHKRRTCSRWNTRNIHRLRENQKKHQRHSNEPVVLNQDESVPISNIMWLDPNQVVFSSNQDNARETVHFMPKFKPEEEESNNNSDIDSIIVNPEMKRLHKYERKIQFLIDSNNDNAFEWVNFNRLRMNPFYRHYFNVLQSTRDFILTSSDMYSSVRHVDPNTDRNFISPQLSLLGTFLSSDWTYNYTRIQKLHHIIYTANAFFEAISETIHSNDDYERQTLIDCIMYIPEDINHRLTLLLGLETKNPNLLSILMDHGQFVLDLVSEITPNPNDTTENLNEKTFRDYYDQSECVVRLRDYLNSQACPDTFNTIVCEMFFELCWRFQCTLLMIFDIYRQHHQGVHPNSITTAISFTLSRVESDDTWCYHLEALLSRIIYIAHQYRDKIPFSSSLSSS